MAKKKQKVGRKLMLDERRSKRILKAMLHGLPLARAALCAGVSKDTLFRWLRKGRLDHEKKIQSPFQKFYSRVKSAGAEAEDIRADMIYRTGKKVWTAAAWYLERRHPERWAKKDGLQVKGKLEAEATIHGEKTTLPPPAELLKMLVEVMGKEAAMQIIAGNGAEVQKRIGSNGQNGDTNGRDQDQH